MATAKLRPRIGNARSLDRVAGRDSTSQGQKGIATAKVSPGRFGVYGGRYAPEILMFALEELERAYEEAKRDTGFDRRLDQLPASYARRPSTLIFAPRLT